MPSTTAVKVNGSEGAAANAFVVDLETRLTKDDHQALRLWLRLMSCTLRIENQVRGRLRQDFSTTLPRFDLMAQLERNPDGLRMSEISKRLMVSGGNVTGITDQLEKDGLVARVLDPKDRRAVTVKLTDAGLKKFRQIAQQHEEWIVETFDGLTREEKQALFGLLKKLKLHVEQIARPQAAAAGARKR